jgi:hypothetical protein
VVLVTGTVVPAVDGGGSGAGAVVSGVDVRGVVVVERAAVDAAVVVAVEEDELSVAVALVVACFCDECAGEVTGTAGADVGRELSRTAAREPQIATSSTARPARRCRRPMPRRRGRGGMIRVVPRSDRVSRPKAARSAAPS